MLKVWTDVEAFHKRPLEDKYIYLFLDGVHLGIKGAVKRKKRPVLLAYGITEDGQRELVGFRVARSESEAQWVAFLNDLYKRGLEGERLKLIVIDGGKGLIAALDVVYPYTKRGRCWAHKLRNVAIKLERVHLKPCMAEAKDIFNAPSRREAIKRFKTWKERWHVEEERAVRCMEKDLYHCLHYYSFPRELWKRIRTTNLLERAFREVRRRTRPMGFFPTDDSAQRIFYGVTNGIHQNGHHPLPIQSQQKS